MRTAGVVAPCALPVKRGRPCGAAPARPPVGGVPKCREYALSAWGGPPFRPADAAACEYSGGPGGTGGGSARTACKGRPRRGLQTLRHAVAVVGRSPFSRPCQNGRPDPLLRRLPRRPDGKGPSGASTRAPRSARTPRPDPRGAGRSPRIRPGRRRLAAGQVPGRGGTRAGRRGALHMRRRWRIRTRQPG